MDFRSDDEKYHLEGNVLSMYLHLLFGILYPLHTYLRSESVDQEEILYVDPANLNYPHHHFRLNEDLVPVPTDRRIRLDTVFPHRDLRIPRRPAESRCQSVGKGTAAKDHRHHRPLCRHCRDFGPHHRECGTDHLQADHGPVQ